MQTVRILLSILSILAGWRSLKVWRCPDERSLSRFDPMTRWTIALKFCPDELCIGIIKIIKIIGNGWASDRFLKFCPCQMRVRPKKPSKGVCGESVEKCPVSSVSPVKHYSELISALPMIESSSGSSGMDEPAPKSPHPHQKRLYTRLNAIADQIPAIALTTC